ncbi:MAG: hypothetical protein LBL66_10840 [Clostridiales bacterium]|nr:hypothetical protein [Clostridiales bacterium]
MRRSVEFPPEQAGRRARNIQHTKSYFLRQHPTLLNSQFSILNFQFSISFSISLSDASHFLSFPHRISCVAKMYASLLPAAM